MVVLGIDEVGRGCLAGPLVVGAVALAEEIVGLKDSKLLSRKQREFFSGLIIDKALFVGIGWASVDEIDSLGLTSSLSLAAQRALEGLDLSYDRAVLDGNHRYIDSIAKLETLVKADMSVPAVSAASIVAKVARDKYMISLAAEFPDYGFDKHVGYGTKAHFLALTKYGNCIHHRRSFEPIKSMLLV